MYLKKKSRDSVEQPRFLTLLQAQLALWPSLVGPAHLLTAAILTPSMCQAPSSALSQVSPNLTPQRQRYHSPYFTDKETRPMMVK